MMHHPARLCLFALTLVLLPLAVPAQEALDAILARGHVEHWLVAGPFPPDLDGGMIPRVQAEEGVLGTRDLMAPVGGILEVKPRHLLQVQTADGMALWQQAGTKNPRLDLGPFFAGKPEGIAFAAFYAESAAVQDVYVDLQTVLGARVWLNGLLVKDYAPKPVAAAGLDRFPVRFLRGTNLMVIEVPGIRLMELAQASKSDENTLVRETLANRPLLRGASGWEIALKLYPVEAAGPVAYVPRLESTGLFSQGANGLEQQAALILYNYTDSSTPEVLLEVTLPRAPAAQYTTPPLAPKEEHRELLMVPVSQTAEGKDVNVAVKLSIGAFEAAFTAPLTALRPESGGKVYVSTGYYGMGDDFDIDTVARQTAIFKESQAYGFDLGPSVAWMPRMTVLGADAASLREAVALGQVAAHVSYSRVDESLASGELIARNFAYGMHTSSVALGDSRQSYTSLSSLIAPQTPQLLSLFERPGVVVYGLSIGVPPLYRQLALAGENWHRRVSPFGSKTLDQFRENVTRSHEDVAPLGLDADVYVHVSSSGVPAEYLVGAAEELRLAMPSILLTGAAPRYFLETLGDAAPNPANLLPQAQALDQTQMIGYPSSGPEGLMAKFPDLNQSYTKAFRLAQAAESLSTIAGLLGANFPDAPLEHTWRQLIQVSPMSGSNRSYSNALATIRSAAETGAAIRQNAAQYIADNVDTLSGSVTSMQDALPLVVFNPTSFARTDICEAEVDLPAFTGLQIHDDQGEDVPFSTTDIRRRDTRINGARLVFTASDVPAFGYRTYYLTARSQAAEPVRGSETVIENEILRVSVGAASGIITGLELKDSDEEFASRPLNILRAQVNVSSFESAIWAHEDSGENAGTPTSIVSRRATGFQEVKTSAPFDEGTATQTYRLYAGLPWVDCELTLDGCEGSITSLEFRAPDLGRMPMYGERFGAIMARRGQPELAFTTQGGSAFQPALDWAAMTPVDDILVPERGEIPLMPCQIIHGRDHVLQRAAQDIARALMSRGIPAATFDGMPVLGVSDWDKTELGNLDGDLVQGQVMRIVIGSPEQNAITQRLGARMPPELAAYLTKRLPLGATAYFEDSEGPDKAAPIPTILLAGSTVPVTLQQVGNFIDGIRTRGAFPIPPEAYAGTPPPAPANSGLAIFFNGPMLCTTSSDGTLSLLLLKKGFSMGDADAAPQHNRYTWRYRIYPFSGDWREARVPQQAEAFNQPLIAVQTTQHNGLRPQTYSFVDFDSDGFIVSALKPAGYSLLTSEPRNPHNGIIIRGHEAFGRPWQGKLDFMVDLTRAGWANGEEDYREALQVTGPSVSLEVPPFGIRNLLLLPNTRYSHALPKDLAPEVAEEDVYASYWQHESGAPTMDAAAFTMLLRESVPGDTVQVYLCNLHSQRRAEGVVEFEAPPGYALLPASLAYTLDAGGAMAQDVRVMKEADATAPLVMVATTIVDGSTFRTALAQETPQVSATVKRTGAQLTVTLVNGQSISATGAVELVTPPWAWPVFAEDTGDTAHPRRAALSLLPGETKELLFRAGEGLPNEAIVVKVAANGNVQYAKIE
jgi:hypothetical protein